MNIAKLAGASVALALIFGGNASCRAQTSTTAASRATTSSRPNILFIVADDQGYGETEPFGDKQIPTPNIDTIAKNGIKFTQGYVTCPLCGPSRAGLLTGRYQQRFGFEANCGPHPDPNFGVPTSETMLPKMLKQVGYQTGAIGKWHLGFSPDKHPNSRGFDSYFGFLGGAHNYFDVGKDAPILRNRTQVGTYHYLTTEFGNEAVKFIDNNSSQPFFLYLAFNAVHAPLQAPPEIEARFANIKDPRRKSYAAMTSAMDDEIGHVLDALHRHGLENNTLVVYISDNGSPRGAPASNKPLRGFKSEVYEGGIRTPWIIQWKGVLPAGTVYDKPVISLDLMPTVLAITGAKLPEGDKIDGKNLLPYLTGKDTSRPHDVLYWRYDDYTNQGAIRKGDWKMLFHTKHEDKSTPWELYNLATDIGESQNVAAEHPDVVKELSDAWKKWDSQLAEPGWLDSRTRAKFEQEAGGKVPAGRKARGPGKIGKRNRANQNAANANSSSTESNNE
jgi:arylsulfatase A-like enzyme